MADINLQNGLLIGLAANLKSEGTAYNSLKKISNYLYEIRYSEIDYKDGEKYYKEKYTPINAACSSLRKGNFIGRNFDWTYDNYASFIVYTQATNKRHGVVGVANGLKTLTPEMIDSGLYSKEYSYIPFALHDGINDEGLVCNINIVPAGDKGLTTGTDTTKPDMCVLMLVRYILDYASNVDEAIELIKSRNIIGINTEEKIEEVHFMISDPNKTVVVEFIDNEIKVIENQNIMTNFYLYDFDGNTITGFKENREIQPNETTLTAHAAGVERYDILSEVYSELQDKQDILDAMQEVWYTNTYKDETTPKWYSEYTGDTPYGDITIYMSPDNNLLNQAFNIGKNNYEIRTREDELTWQTVHTSVYDIENKQLTLMFQENSSKHIFNFVEQKLPLTVTFNADGKSVAILSVDSENNVIDNPLNANIWENNGNKIVFPFTVTQDIVLNKVDLYNGALLLHCDAFTDASVKLNSLTNVGVEIDNTIKKFGNGSFKFVENTDHIEIGNTNFDFGNNDFTIDLWAYPTSFTGSIIGCWGSGLEYTWLTSTYGSNGAMLFAFSTGGSATIITTDNGVLTLNTWQHIAVTRKREMLRIFVNGNIVKEQNIGTATLRKPLTPLWIGKNNDTSYNPNDHWSGYLDEIRILNGTCAWDSNFTPPAQEY